MHEGSTRMHRRRTHTLLALATVLSTATVEAQQDAGVITDGPTRSAQSSPPTEPVTAVMEDVPGVAVSRGRAETIIDAPFERVAREMLNFGAYAEFMPHLGESRVVHRNRALTDVYLQAPLGRSLGVMWSLVRVRATRSRDRLELVGAAVDGNMDRFDTHAIIERREDGTTRFVFSLLALPRLPFPNSVFSRENRDVARTVAYNLRTRIASNPTVALAP